MVYTTALVLGQGHGGMPTTTTLISEEEEEQQSLVEMIGNFLSQLISSEKSRSSRCVAAADRRGSVDSCDSEADKNSPYTDLHSRLEEEDEARLLQRDMTRQIERCLSEAKGSAALPYCEMLLLPRHLSARVGRDLVRSSAGEPCGLRGASVHVYLQEESKDAPLKALGSFSPEPSVTPTFELSVVFKVDHGGWPPALKHMFVTDNKVLKLRPEYRLVKRKLYSSASPVVRDFS